MDHDYVTSTATSTNVTSSKRKAVDNIDKMPTNFPGNSFLASLAELKSTYYDVNKSIFIVHITKILSNHNVENLEKGGAKNVKNKCVSIQCITEIISGTYEKTERIISSNMSDSRPSRHVSYEQVKTIIDFMGQHIEFASGSLRSLEARHTSKRLWNELTKILNNSRLGAKKTSDGWSKYWSDFKNKLKNKVTYLKKRRKCGSLSKKCIKPLSRLEKRALVILGPNFEKKICKVSKEPFNNVSCDDSQPLVKLESHGENGHDICNESFDMLSDPSTVSEFIADGERESDEESDEPVIQSIYPKWLIEVEKTRAEADLTRARADEQRVTIAAKNAEAALLQAEALKKMAEAATTQAEALTRIACLLENKIQKEKSPI